MDTGVLRFGSFELDCGSRELRAGARRVRLQEQPFEILRLMLEHPGDVVTREQLRQRLWPDGTFVDFEHSLNAAIKRLRAALEDDADHPRFVETVPRRGYRFIAPVGSTPRAPEESHTARPRLAVLPFANLSDDSSQEYFSDGLTEEMIAQLGTLCRDRIGVLARWSSMVFKGSLQRAREVGEALRADYLLEGSVRRDGARVRITARLIETRDETQLWSETYERAVVDYLSVQTEVATRIARSLAMELAPAPVAGAATAPDAEAYQAYLKGRYYWNKPGDSGLDQALLFFCEGLKIAPTFAAAHAATARAMVARAEYYRDVPRTALEQARQAADRSLELDPNQAEGYLAMGDVSRMLYRDWSRAESCYARAITLNPSYEGARRSRAMMLSALGRHEEALRESERAVELDPFCLVMASSAAWMHYAAGDYKAAIARCRHTIDMDPEYLPARRILGAAYLQAGLFKDAIAALEDAAAIGSGDPVVLAWLAHAKGVTRAPEYARDLLVRVHALEKVRHVPAYHLALAYIGLDDVDKAFELLERAYAECDPVLPGVSVEPRFDPLRGDFRYRDLLARLDMPSIRDSGLRLRHPGLQDRTR